MAKMTIRNGFWAYVRKTWVLWTVIVGALKLYHWKMGQFVTLLYLLAPVAAVMLVAERILDPRDGWGLFPDFNLQIVIRRGQMTPLSCAVMWLGLCLVMSTIIIAAAMLSRP